MNPTSATQRILLLLALAMQLVGCRQPNTEDEPNKGPAIVIVDSYPIYYFARQIVGEEAQIRFPAEKSSDPLQWTPSMEEISQIQSADLILLNGAGYSPWVQIVSLPMDRTVVTFDQKEKLIPAQTFVHNHGSQGTDSATRWVSSVWLDFAQAKVQAASIYQSLLRILPDSSDRLKNNFDRLNFELDQLQQATLELKKKIGTTPLVVSGSDFVYLVRAASMKAITVDLKKDSLPEDVRSSDLKKILESGSAKVILWDGQPEAATSKLLSSDYHLTVIPLYTGNRAVDAGDWLYQMKQNLSRLSGINSE